jgi:oligoendopeptidase F
MKPLRVLLFVLASLVAFGPALAASPVEEVIYYESRDEIPMNYQWDLTPIFASQADYDRAFAEVDRGIAGIEAYRGRLGDSAERLASGLQAVSDLFEQTWELAVYAGQSRDTKTTDPEALDRYNRFQALAAKAFQTVSFVEPEIAEIPDKKLEKYRKNEKVRAFDHYLDNIVRQKPHIRSAEVEEVLASAALMAGAPQDAYSNMVDADIEWPKIRGEKGDSVVVTPALYYSFLANQNRDIRREAGLALFRTYDNYGNTFAATYGGHVQRNLFFAKNRGFERALEAKLFELNIPYDVIASLVAAVHDNYPLIHRYISLREEVLGIDDHHVYDLYVSLIPEWEKKISYEEGYKLALDFWKETYGEEYFTVGKMAYDDRWIDVYGHKGKRGGAYSWGSYNSHPYLLLNWGGTLEDVFTLVHEMGHSIHTYLTTENQPFHYSDYSPFVAEVASVASEALLLDYMLDRAESDMERLYLLDLYLGNIVGTFIRQIFFHEFEENSHKMAEAGEALTKETLRELHGKLWQDYYGPELVLDDEFKADWCRIPHFYRTFYVWSYASSFAAGEAIAARVRAGEKGAVEDYLAMLKLGGSVYPMEALTRAGVDMTDPKVIQTVMKRFGETLDQMTVLLRGIR